MAQEKHEKHPTTSRNGHSIFSEASPINNSSAMPSPGQRQASDFQYMLKMTILVPFTANHKYPNMVQPSSSFLPVQCSSHLLLLIMLLSIVAQR